MIIWEVLQTLGLAVICFFAFTKSYVVSVEASAEVKKQLREYLKAQASSALVNRYTSHEGLHEEIIEGLRGSVAEEVRRVAQYITPYELYNNHKREIIEYASKCLKDEEFIDSVIERIKRKQL